MPGPAWPQLTWGLRQGGRHSSQPAQARNRGDTQRESALPRHIPNSWLAMGACCEASEANEKVGHVMLKCTRVGQPGRRRVLMSRLDLLNMQ